MSTGALSPLLCIHGISDTSSAWRAVVGPLAQRHRLLVPTLPGHYGGPPLDTTSPVRMAQLVDWLETQLDAAGVETAHIVGNSLGGWLAIELLTRGRARSVVALCPAGGWQRGSRFEKSLSVRMKASQRLARYAEPVMQLLTRNPQLRSVILADLCADPAKLDSYTVRTFLRGLARCDGFSAVMDAVVAERLPYIRPDDPTPVVVAWGEQDRLLPPHGNEPGLRAALPNAEFIRLAGAGHVPMHDDPAAVVRTILDLTRAVDSDTSRGSTKRKAMTQ
ncbi:alpha/beta fold hydrolase [Mycolicibacterium vaccae]|uniref:alpha/beta fold hydrolase n=1 Tax=Mycolicibacterium vaccae TaxID=1810 RepID=UPI003CFF81F3